MNFKNTIKHNTKSIIKYVSTFFKWFLISIVVGSLGGGIGSLFHLGIDYATHFREAFPFVIFFMPFAGVIIVFFYRLAKLSKNGDTNLILKSVRNNEKIPLPLIPLIFFATILTHLVGGSAGREGAALQLGGTIGNRLGSLFRLSDKDKPIIVMCGMASVFSALFGTPLTATVFSVEIVSVGLFHYSAFVPCLMSAISAYGVSLLMHVEPIRFNVLGIETLNTNTIWQAAVIGVACALTSIVFCIVIKQSKKWLSKLLEDEYMRTVAGSLILIAMTVLVGSQKYNGAGMADIFTAINEGKALPYDFVLKLLFTAVTLAAGFKGGEMIPAFYVGATMGCVLGSLIGLSPGFAAALGLIGVFCGAFNCPLASLILSVEFFGAKGIVIFGIVICISYMFSGYYSVYSSQKIMYSKLSAKYINRNAK